MTSQEALTNTRADKYIEPVIGIITALPEEYAAVEVLLENCRDFLIPGSGAGRRCSLGVVSAKNNNKYAVVLSKTEMGNNIAAARAELLLECFPSIEAIVMVGIAGGIPHPRKPGDHVRLGDIVVSGREGVIQYDFVKEQTGETIYRHSPRPPDSVLSEGVAFLHIDEIQGERPWLKHIDDAMHRLGWIRPKDETDILVSSTNENEVIPHPNDSQRKPGQPRVFIGPIASANTLLKDPIKRDQLRDKFGVKAVEMEGSGIADATWNYGKGYLVVRGICDYCDSRKGDDWHRYAAIAAAAYTRALLESMPNIRSTGQNLFLDSLIAEADEWKKLHHRLQVFLDMFST